MALLTNGRKIFHKKYSIDEGYNKHIVRLNGEFWVLTFPNKEDPIQEFDSVRMALGFKFMPEDVKVQFSDLITDLIKNGRGEATNDADIFLEVMLLGEAENAKFEFEKVKIHWERKFRNLEKESLIQRRIEDRLHYLSDLISIQSDFDTSSSERFLSLIKMITPFPESFENWRIEISLNQLTKEQQNESPIDWLEAIGNYYYFSPKDFIEGNHNESKLPKGYIVADPLKNDLEDRLSFIAFNNLLIRWEKDFLSEAWNKYSQGQPRKAPASSNGELTVFQKLFCEFIEDFVKEKKRKAPSSFYQPNIAKLLSSKLQINESTIENKLDRLNYFFEKYTHHAGYVGNIDDQSEKQKLIRLRKDLQGILNYNPSHTYYSDIEEIKNKIDNLIKSY